MFMKHASPRLILAALFAGAALSASAANPFTDVPADSWAYQSVAALSSEGVVEGYPDGTFKGDKAITRYEMAQITARLMEKENALSASQKDAVSKLAAEYADELKNLGVRVAELEKKAGNGNTQVILDMRWHYMPVYDNIYKDSKEKHDVYGARIRMNTITRVNDRIHLYGQGQVLLGLGGEDYILPNKYKYTSDDGEVTLTRLFSTFHFGKGDGNNQGLGPSKDLFLIGQFPVTMGVTGYTYDDTFKGVALQLGDAKEGGKFTLAYGRAAGINYNYTAPMMRGVPRFTSIAGSAIGQKMPSLIDKINTTLGYNFGSPNAKTSNDVAQAIAGTTNYEKLPGNVTEALKSQYGEQGAAKLSALLMGSAGNLLGELGNKLDWGSGTYYPMAPDVKMSEGEDEDVPVAYASYIYKKPQQYEFHLYGMRAIGPVGHIAKAYGTALSYYITDKWNVHGEFVKNLRKLPLNQERPHSFNYGISYGTADVRNEKSYSFGVDYVYSQAGTYFGGSGNDIADQYMGHVYRNWNGTGMSMPAYIGDKMTDMLAGKSGGNYGGAKFFLAKAQYVPKRGLILEANYGFNAEDMGGRKMDNIFRLQATMYYK